MGVKSKYDTGSLSIREMIFAKEYAISGVGSWSAEVAFSGTKLASTYKRNMLVSILLKKKEIRELVEEYRKKFLEKYGADIGEEIIKRARGANDKDAYKYYQQAINMMGLEAAKQTESKQEKVVSFPSHDVPQIEADVTIHEDEVPEAPLLEAAVNKDEKEDDI